ncbi:hypothetical protein ACH4E7_40810 [Kitasatospora sp. NPDC018058]|uniref:hypothetical protein n=1 Tax=Kitasatospora sp. NPDC018058 TaxID=3364025 RepID=UPI0037C11E24
MSFAIPAELVQIGALRRWVQTALAEFGLHPDVSSVRVLRPQPAVGTFPVRPTLRQRPRPAA